MSGGSCFSRVFRRVKGFEELGRRLVIQIVVLNLMRHVSTELALPESALDLFALKCFRSNGPRARCSGGAQCL